MNPIAKTLICLSLAACYASEAPVERVSSPETPESEVKVVAMETEPIAKDEIDYMDISDAEWRE